jgi:hypothetical protein
MKEAGLTALAASLADLALAVIERGRGEASRADVQEHLRNALEARLREWISAGQ